MRNQEWGKVALNVLALFEKREPSRFTHKRLLAELDRQAVNSRKRAGAADARWKMERQEVKVPEGNNDANASRLHGSVHPVCIADADAKSCLAVAVAVAGASSETDALETKNKTVARRKTVGHDPEFDIFWKEYPRHEDGPQALDAWKAAKGKPPLDVIMRALRKAKASAKWAENGGEFIPYAAKWIKGARWAAQDDLFGGNGSGPAGKYTGSGRPLTASEENLAAVRAKMARDLEKQNAADEEEIET
jgi:hypothetical protein